MNEFKNTKAALIVYDAAKPEYDSLWEKVDSEETLKAAQSFDEAAMNKVRKALFEDTKEFNSLEFCMLINPDDSWFRNLVKK